MKVNTRKSKNARRVFEQLYGKQEMIDRYSPSLRGSGCYLFGLKERLGLKILTMF